MEITVTSYAVSDSPPIAFFDTLKGDIVRPGTPKARDQSLSMLALAVVCLSPETLHVVPPVPAAAVVGRHPEIRLAVIVTERGGELFRLVPAAHSPERQPPARREEIIDALGQMIGALTAPAKHEERPARKTRTSEDAIIDHRGHNKVGLQA